MLSYALNTPTHWEQSLIVNFIIVAKDGLFWLSIVIWPLLTCDIMQLQRQTYLHKGISFTGKMATLCYISTQGYVTSHIMEIHSHNDHFSSSPPSATYMHQWISAALRQITACHLFGAKPLSTTMLGYCQLDP